MHQKFLDWSYKAKWFLFVQAVKIIKIYLACRHHFCLLAFISSYTCFHSEGNTEKIPIPLETCTKGFLQLAYFESVFFFYQGLLITIYFFPPLFTYLLSSVVDHHPLLALTVSWSPVSFILIPDLYNVVVFHAKFAEIINFSGYATSSTKEQFYIQCMLTLPELCGSFHFYPTNQVTFSFCHLHLSSTLPSYKYYCFIRYIKILA